MKPHIAELYIVIGAVALAVGLFFFMVWKWPKYVSQPTPPRVTHNRGVYSDDPMMDAAIAGAFAAAQ